MLTVREAMKTGGLSKCRLLAGEAGLDNAITCVDCMEVPNIEPWLRSGELLITTGYALRDDENAIPYLLETLTKGKAAALAIKTRFLGELKDTDIALAQRLGLPLFEMPSDMPTTEMVMPVVRMLTNRQVEIMEFSEKIHKRFTEIELSDGGFRKIAAVLSKLLQMPAAIVDGAGEILAASHIPDNFEDLEDYILQEVLGQGSAAERCPREAKGYTVFSRSVTVREAVRGYILRASEDLLDIMQRTTGKLPYVFPVNMQDITPYGNDVHHINSIMQPCTCTAAPVVGVAITTEMMVPGCGTGCSHMEDIEEAARFVLEVAKDFTAGKISFYDAQDDARMNKLYGSMKHLQQLGNRD